MTLFKTTWQACIKFFGAGMSDFHYIWNLYILNKTPIRNHHTTIYFDNANLGWGKE